MTTVTPSSWMEERLHQLTPILERLIASEPVAFDERLRGKLPAVQGIYAISLKDGVPGDYLRAGKADVSLRQRIYQNHYMGDQSGNLRQQLIKDKICARLEDTKPWIRQHCRVQFLVIENGKERTIAEHLMLAVWQPRYADEGSRGFPIGEKV